MPDPHTLAIEKAIATAHRALTYAAYRADCLADGGLATDLHSLRFEVGRLQMDLLTGRRKRGERQLDLEQEIANARNRIPPP